MQSRPLRTAFQVSGLTSVMEYEAGRNPNHSANKMRGQRNSGHNTSMIHVDPLGIDAFNDSFPPITELNVGSMFAANKKCSEGQNLVASCSSIVNRTVGYGKGLSLAGGFATDAQSVISFQHELSLLEHALHKGESPSVPPTSSAFQTSLEKKAVPSLLEQDIFFSDILTDNVIPPQNISIKNEDDEEDEGNNEDDDEEDEISNSHTPPGRTGSRHIQDQCAILKDKKTSMNAEMDAETARALANLVGCDAPGGLRNLDSSANSLKRYDMTFSNVTRDQENADGNNVTRNSSSSRNSSVIADPVPYSELQDYRSLGTVPKEIKGSSATRQLADGENRKGGCLRKSEIINQANEQAENMVHSPISDSSMTGFRAVTHPDLYENLCPADRAHVDRLRDKISPMPRRKLRENLAKLVTMNDVDPLMSINRDELAGMLGLGVTTWKMFVHQTLGIPRWPARALKSQRVKEKKLLQKKLEAERRGELELAGKIEQELMRMIHAHMKRRELFRSDSNRKGSNSRVAKS